LPALCRRFHVRRLDLCGSAARGNFDPGRSNIDFIVEVDRYHPQALAFGTCFGLKASLEPLFITQRGLNSGVFRALRWRRLIRVIGMRRPAGLCARGYGSVVGKHVY
jgi:predicted nucleotidyltransferase